MEVVIEVIAEGNSPFKVGALWFWSGLADSAGDENAEST